MLCKCLYGFNCESGHVKHKNIKNLLQYNILLQFCLLNKNRIAIFYKETVFKLK